LFKINLNGGGGGIIALFNPYRKMTYIVLVMQGMAKSCIELQQIWQEIDRKI